MPERKVKKDNLVNIPITMYTELKITQDTPLFYAMRFIYIILTNNPEKGEMPAVIVKNGLLRYLQLPDVYCQQHGVVYKDIMLFEQNRYDEIKIMKFDLDRFFNEIEQEAEDRVLYRQTRIAAAAEQAGYTKPTLFDRLKW